MIRRVLYLAMLSLALSGGAARAQIPVEFGPGSGQLSRADLTRLLAQFEEAIGSPAYSGRVKDAARASAERIRDRLENGDFRVGDRVDVSQAVRGVIPE